MTIETLLTHHIEDVLRTCVRCFHGQEKHNGPACCECHCERFVSIDRCSCGKNYEDSGRFRRCPHCTSLSVAITRKEAADIAKATGGDPEVWDRLFGVTT